MQRRGYLGLVCGSLLCSQIVVSTAGQETVPFFAEPVIVATSEVSEFLGSWTLSMDLNGQPVEMKLDLADVEGSLSASLSSTLRPEGRGVTSLSKDGDVLALTWITYFQGQQMALQMHLSLAEDGLRGTFGDSGGAFAAELEGRRGSGPVPAPSPSEVLD